MKLLKEMLVGALVGIIITVFFLAANYYTNIEKNEVYMEMYGYFQNSDGEWVKENE